MGEKILLVGDIPARSVSAHGIFRLPSTSIKRSNIRRYGDYSEVDYKSLYSVVISTWCIFLP